MIGRQIFYEGRVQGVGFRYTVKQIAKGYDVVGWVRNLEDGRVELQCSGKSQEIEDFIEGIAESQLKSHIKSVTAVPIPPFNQRGFEFRT